MKSFAKSERTTTFFRDLAIQQIKIAYRCMEYLAPDTVFSAKTEPDTFNLLLLEKYEPAAERIIVEAGGCVDSAHWSERLLSETIELLQDMVSEYMETKADEKARRIKSLLEELSRLEGGTENG
jgi:hypothetical protein